ncbi:MAG: hypothetical protein JW993_01040, partial [Sedimentisphaerales bacterium]|nr:hypothetical protein [Sedimentisphaerales bacterium]
MYRCISVLAVVLVVSASAMAVLVDDFEGYGLGQVDTVTTKWVGTADVTIETDPTDPQNQVIRVWENSGTQKAVYGVLDSEASIPQGATKTVFLRFRATNAIDSAFGLTNVDSPDVGGNDWGQFGPQVSVLSGNFRVRDSGSWLIAQPYTPLQWYNLWMVIDNATDSMKVYVHDRPDEGGTEADRVTAGGGDSFGFRNAISDALDRFYWRAQNPSGERYVWIDDIHVMPGVSLSNPLKTGTASSPSPEDEATDVRRDAVLTWMPGLPAATHDVYFDTSFEDVNSASRTNPLGVLVSESQPAAAYDPEGLLAFGRTYYWRIDEVNTPPDSTIFKGQTWSFEVEPVAYPVENITVTASTTSAAGSGPVRCIDHSGLNAAGQHSILEADMWVGAAAAGEPAWIQFDFDRVYKLQDTHVWNYNHQYESFLGLGLKDVTIEYLGADGQWQTLGDFEVPQAPGLATYAGSTIDFGGVGVQSVRINIHGNRSALQPLTYGLSEIQFNYIPTHAREPEPADGATEMSVEATLRWRPGREAVTHQVNLSTDPNAVADGTALVDVVSVPTYDPGTLALATTYYWRVDEVNEAATPSVWQSNLWRFSTQAYLAVDDFESYTDDEGNLIYEAWQDGFGVTTNGSQVGHDEPPYAEQDLVHSGDQSMPFAYGQDGATVSEATLTLAAQDWTRAGAQTLVVYFRGTLGNAAGQVYLKVNNTRVDYPGSTASLAAPLWTQWNVELASLGNAARNVTSLTFGVSSSGMGQLYVDDIRLYREAPPMPAPAVDPGANGLAASYQMEGNLNDGSGNGRDGTAETGSSFAAGLAGYGQALVLDGTSGHATLPIGTLIQSLESMTVATWVNYSGTGGAWARVFDFGTGATVYTFLAQRNGGNAMEFAITTAAGGGESQVTAPSALPT